MNNRSRSTLFLIEQLIVIAVFAVCAAACVKILTDAYFTTNHSKDVSNALLAAENSAESFKAAGGDLSQVARILGGDASTLNGAPVVIVYFDKQWSACGDVSGASYVLRLTVSQGNSSSLQSGDISVEKLTGEELVALTVTARSH